MAGLRLETPFSEQIAYRILLLSQMYFTVIQQYQAYVANELIDETYDLLTYQQLNPIKISKTTSFNVNYRELMTSNCSWIGFFILI
jgi:hypothetical protein